MIFKHFKTSFLEANNYILIDEISKEAVLIDCTEKNPAIYDFLDEQEAELKYILLTHGHFDHVLGVNEFKKRYPDCTILVHKNDETLLENIDTFMAGFGFAKTEIQNVDGFVSDNQIIKIGANRIKAIHIPGHSPGSCGYLIDDKFFAGDTIFYECIGRTDLFGGSYSQLKNSVEQRIFTLDDNTTIYPGHGISTTVGHEKTNNKFL